jgi:hypothetical protein
MAVLTTGWVGLAGAASAAPGDSSAQDAVDQLRSQGHNVQVVNATGPLHLCTVDRVRTVGEAAPTDDTSGPNRTVFVEVSCPDSDDFGP